MNNLMMRELRMSRHLLRRQPSPIPEQCSVTYHFFFLCIRKPTNCLIIGFYRNLRVLGKHEHIYGYSQPSVGVCLWRQAIASLLGYFGKCHCWSIGTRVNTNQSNISLPRWLNSFHTKTEVASYDIFSFGDWIGYQSVSVSNWALAQK